MKSIKIIALGIAFFSYAAIASAETVTSTATAAATATIITPITITRTVDLSFGNILPGTTGGTVVVSPSGGRTQTGGITFPLSGPAPTAASFLVTGMTDTRYSITIPATIELINGGNSMTVAITPLTETSGTLTTGSQTISIGATLTVAANQPTGLYTSSQLTVTVNMQ